MLRRTHGRKRVNSDSLPARGCNVLVVTIAVNRNLLQTLFVKQFLCSADANSVSITLTNYMEMVV